MSKDIDKLVGSSLVIRDDQSGFTSDQLAVLDHMGVKGASAADLRVFFHRCRRAGLDPFSGQIHMICRRTWNPDTRETEPRWTIQTGIDGYYVIARRAADAASVTVAIDAPQWLHETGDWRPAWSNRWGFPIAARVSVHRGDAVFTAVANFDEYVQIKGNGEPTRMWSQRRAAQLAKCATALALRAAFPEDLSGIYVDDEMHQANNHAAPAPWAPVPSAAATFTARPPRVAEAPAPGGDDEGPVDGEVVDEAADTTRLATPEQRAAIVDALPGAGLHVDLATEEGRRQVAEYIAHILGGVLITHTRELTTEQAAAVLDALTADAEALAADEEAQS